MRTTIPSDEELDRRTAALLPSVLASIASTTKARRRKRVSIVGAGAAAIFAGGLLVGATWIAPTFNPANGGSVNAQGVYQPTVFSVECHDSDGANDDNAVDQQFSDQSQANTAIADLASFCTTALNGSRINDAVTAKAFQLAATGVPCGTIEVAGHTRWQWNASKDTSGKLAVSASDGTSTDWPATCNRSVVTVAVPAYAPSSVAVCKVAENWAAVYPATDTTPSDVCAKRGQTLWNS